jgi:2-methylcitrate dehydratase PrpD
MSASTPGRPATDAVADLTAMIECTRLEDLAAHTVKAARLSLLDTIGCAIAGRKADGVAAVQDLILTTGGRGQSSVWGTGRSVPAEAAAFANAMAGHALDYDDQHPGVLHTGVCVVPAAIAMAEATGLRSIEPLLEAIVVATEVADRLAVATTTGPGVSGWLLTPLCGYFGAAAAAAKIAGLGSKAVRNALGFAYVQTSGNGQSTLDGALAKRMQPGFAARGGVFAAQLAERGLTAPWNSLEGQRGFFHVYHKDKYDREALRSGIGDRWLIDTATFKPYPCCAWTHAALECGLMLHGKVEAADIASVQIGVNEQAYQSTGTPLARRYRPKTEVDAQFSIPYMFALAAIYGEIKLTDFNAAFLAREEVAAIAELVTVYVDAELEGAHGREISPARAMVKFVDGSSQESVVLEPRGMGDRPLHRVEILAKFQSCCEYGALPKESSERIANIVLDGHDERLPELARLLRANQ